MTSLLIGCGNLGQIILEEFSKKKRRISVLEKNIKVCKNIKKKFSNVDCFSDQKKVNWDKVNYIMICVKPKDSKKVISEIKNYCTKNHVILSFIAGLQTETISKWIISKSSVIRIMPNIFISSNNSSTAVYANNLKSKIKKKVDKDFGDFGEIIWVNKEEKIDFFTAMFGGGPAYFFYILNCFNEIIKKNGFTENESLSAIKFLLKGVLEDIKKKNYKFSDSIRKVASKGGTTEEGLKVLSKSDNLFKLFEKAIMSAERKSKIISKKLQ